ncbi:MAG: hypothetical protein IJ573_00635 [Clostridia bacterium]|nr:hypothetical protein [Clostridia bacterium]
MQIPVRVVSRREKERGGPERLILEETQTAEVPRSLVVEWTAQALVRFAPEGQANEWASAFTDAVKAGAFTNIPG